MPGDLGRAARLTLSVVGSALLLAGCGSGAQRDAAAIPTPDESLATSTPTGGSTAATPAPTPTSQATIVAQLPGPTTPTCVTPRQRNARSGGIGAGDFTRAQQAFKSGGSGKEGATVTLHVIPANPGGMSGLDLKATRDRKAGPTVASFTSTKTDVINGTRYYVMDFDISAPGVWRLEFVSGKDKGCFEVAFNRPQA